YYLPDTGGTENYVAAATTGPAPLNEVFRRNCLQFFDAPPHWILAHLLKSLGASHSHNDTALGIIITSLLSVPVTRSARSVRTLSSSQFSDLVKCRLYLH
ncbi:MAG: hypothetical protein NTW28_08135, partial [Candidatus Solibacter sp.]|nr:hypothetical protein [Candidatus Solibacter sp.]